MRHSWFEATARQRLAGLLDAGSFSEILPPSQATPSPHLAQLGLPGAFDDGVVIGRGQLAGKQVFVAAQEGQFMGGAVGETHGAKIVGLLQKAVVEQPAAVLLLIDSGGVRLHEANAGLIAISEIMRAVLAARAAGVPVIGLIGGTCGAFGGMGIVACLCSRIVMSEEGRLALSGPEVIETVAGVEEFDAKDRALVWRVTGGKHRYLMGDADELVDDDIVAFRAAALDVLSVRPEPVEGERTDGESDQTLAMLEAKQSQLTQRLETFGDASDGLDVWRRLGLTEPQAVPMLDTLQLRHIKGGLAS